MAKTVTILGAGAVGLCTALSLAGRGTRVRLIDRGEPGQETSRGNAGVISPWSIVPQAMPGTLKKVPGLMTGPYKPLSVRRSYWPRMVPWGLRFLQNGTEARVQEIADAMEVLCMPSIDLYRRHLEGTGQGHLVQDSTYVHAFRSVSETVLEGLDYRIRREKGAQMELVRGADLNEIEPALSKEFQAAVVIRNQARALSPGRIMEVLAEKARSLGVDILRRNIRTLERTAIGWAVTCDGDRIECEAIVLAMGAWSAELLKPLGLHVPLAAERGYHLEFEDAGITLNNSVLDTDAKFVASSMDGGLRVAGMAEFGDVDAPLDPKKEHHLRQRAKAAFPELRTEKATFWMGRRPSFPDSLPMIGEFAGQPGLFAGFGHSHYGLMMAPKTGELLADLINGPAPNVDCSPYDPGRFSVMRG